LQIGKLEQIGKKARQAQEDRSEGSRFFKVSFHFTLDQGHRDEQWRGVFELSECGT
jgi:hypothetical protein